jgi:hypothetical protein
MGAERLLQSFSPETEAERPQNVTTAFLIALSRLLSLSAVRTKVFRSLIACKTFYHQTCSKNFLDLALLAIQHRLAFQNRLSGSPATGHGHSAVFRPTYRFTNHVSGSSAVIMPSRMLAQPIQAKRLSCSPAREPSRPAQTSSNE